MTSPWLIKVRIVPTTSAVIKAHFSVPSSNANLKKSECKVFFNIFNPRIIIKHKFLQGDDLITFCNESGNAARKTVKQITISLYPLWYFLKWTFQSGAIVQVNHQLSISVAKSWLFPTFTSGCCFLVTTSCPHAPWMSCPLEIRRGATTSWSSRYFWNFRACFCEGTWYLLPGSELYGIRFIWI